MGVCGRWFKLDYDIFFKEALPEPLLVPRMRRAGVSAHARWCSRDAVEWSGGRAALMQRIMRRCSWQVDLRLATVSCGVP